MSTSLLCPPAHFAPSSHLLRRVPYTFLVIYAQKHGVTVGRSVLIFSLMGITNGFGRITFGEIADLSIGRLPMLRLSMILAGTATICWIACKTFESLLAFGLIYSFVAGGSVSIVPSAAADIFGVKKISSFLGILFTIGSVGNLLSSPIAGYMSDSYNSYSPAIILSGCCQILGSCLLMTMTKEEAADDSHSPSPASSHKPVARTTNGDVISDSQASSVKVSNPRVISSGEEEEVIVTDEEIAIELTVVRRDFEVVQKEEAI
jgi:MFS family permease